MGCLLVLTAILCLANTVHGQTPTSDDFKRQELESTKNGTIAETQSQQQDQQQEVSSGLSNDGTLTVGDFQVVFDYALKEIMMSYNITVEDVQQMLENYSQGGSASIMKTITDPETGKEEVISIDFGDAILSKAEVDHNNAQKQIDNTISAQQNEFNPMELNTEAADPTLGLNRGDPNLERSAQTSVAGPPSIPRPLDSDQPSYEELRQELSRMQAREMYLLRRLRILSARYLQMLGRRGTPVPGNAQNIRIPFIRRINFRRSPQRTLSGIVTGRNVRRGPPVRVF
ncbi:uncharacterized protein LOC133202111 [Saccostrea echinata]|uniref:uncharacterized protein LOC133202111 n=1 Tax=Saccostrea echinata TaxID=191078 RepID=UPI002A81727D|nr:uncharacterized protein LOC133202111 [Saccostrea echinata]